MNKKQRQKKKKKVFLPLRNDTGLALYSLRHGLHLVKPRGSSVALDEADASNYPQLVQHSFSLVIVFNKSRKEG